MKFTLKHISRLSVEDDNPKNPFNPLRIYENKIIDGTSGPHFEFLLHHAGKLIGVGIKSDELRSVYFPLALTTKLVKDRRTIPEKILQLTIEEE